MPRALGVIPARFQSARFPGKPLAPLGDATMLEMVWRRVVECDALDEVIVATDDRRIEEAAGRFGATTMMTERDHPSGTDRVAEVVRRTTEPYPIVVNVQGDEPLVTPTAIARLVASLEPHVNDDATIATLSEPIDDPREVADPNVVKVVVDEAGDALYFSRAPIPYARIDGDASADELARLAPYRKHQGIYAYTAASLARLTALPASTLERVERLEQLRALEAGFRIAVIPSDFRSHGVDTPRDLQTVARLLGLAEAQ